MIYPPDMSTAAIADRADLGAPDPDFEVDVELVDVGGSRRKSWTKAQAEVVVEAKDGDATFTLYLKTSSLPEEFESDGSGRYSITLNSLNGGRQPPSFDTRDWEMRLPKSTREGMLIWWDEHQETIERIYAVGRGLGEDTETGDMREFARDPGTSYVIAETWIFANGPLFFEEEGAWEELFTDLAQSTKLPREAVERHLLNGWTSRLAEQIQQWRTDHPDEREVERQLRTAGLPVRRGRLDVSWNTAVWNLGRVPDTDDEFFLVDSEEEIRGISQFAFVIRRDHGGMSIDELGSGSLKQMISLAQRT